MLLPVGFLLHVCAMARPRRSTWVSLSPWQGVSRKKWAFFLKELSRCERNSLQLLLLLSGPQTQEILSLAGEPANKPALGISTGSFCWKEMTQTRKCASSLSLTEQSPSEQTLGHFNKYQCQQPVSHRSKETVVTCFQCLCWILEDLYSFRVIQTEGSLIFHPVKTMTYLTPGPDGGCLTNWSLPKEEL